MKRKYFDLCIAIAMAFCVLGGSTDAVAQKPAQATQSTQAPAPPKASEDITSEATSLLDSIDVEGLWSANSYISWLILLAAIFLGLAAGRIIAVVLGRIAARLHAQHWPVRACVIEDLIGPAKLALLAIGLAVGLANISMGDTLHTFHEKVLILLYTIAAFWYLFNLVSVIDVMMRRFTAKTDSALDDQFVPLIRKTLRIFLVVIGMLVVVEKVFGQDIGAWLAGLGIAGLAISLAAQDSLKNLFGSITILFDRPFQLGERILYKNYDGIVEEIGFRSTKVRTLTGHLVTIPNSNIVNDPVENIGVRKSIRRTMNVTITYDTSREKVEQAVEILRNILEEDGIREPIHPTIDGNEYPPRVYFNNYNAESLNIFVIYWYAPPAYWDYMDHAQRLNLRMFEEFERAGIEFAFPTQTIYLAGDPKRELALKMLGQGMQ